MQAGKHPLVKGRGWCGSGNESTNKTEGVAIHRASQAGVLIRDQQHY